MYPVRVDAERQQRYHRWLPLVKWLLAFPHYVVLLFLLIGLAFAKLAAFFAVLFTGRYPRGIFDYVVGVMQWGWRVQSYVGLLRDEYPPFRLDQGQHEPGHAEPNGPATVSVPA